MAEYWGQLKGNHSFPDFKLGKTFHSIGTGANDDLKICSMKPHRMKLVTDSHFVLKRDLGEKFNPTFLTTSDNKKYKTFINRKQLHTNEQIILRNNDSIQIGKLWMTAFTFKDENTFPVFDSIIKEKFHIVKFVESGGGGSVFMGYNLQSNKRTAIKIIQINYNLDKECAKNEIRALRRCNHANIVKILDADFSSKICFFTMEFMNGSLKDTVKNTNNGMTQELTKHYIFQVSTAVDYLRTINIVHRDIKPANVLVRTTVGYCLAKLADFGSAKILSNETRLHTPVGTEYYMAPEIVNLDTRESYTSNCEVWSIGVTTFYSLTKKHFDSNNVQRVNIRSSLLLNGLKDITANLLEFLEGALVKNPAKRKSIEKIMLEKWFDDEEMKNRIKHLQTEDN